MYMCHGMPVKVRRLLPSTMRILGIELMLSDLVAIPLPDEPYCWPFSVFSPLFYFLDLCHGVDCNMTDRADAQDIWGFCHQASCLSLP